MRAEQGFGGDAHPGTASGTARPERLVDRVPDDEQASVVALIDCAGFKVFVIPRRFVTRPGGDLPFHNVGGKRGPGEEWIEALQREATEEIGLALSVRSAEITRQVTTANELAPLTLADQPRPYCIYHRTRDVDPEVPEPTTRWIVGYEADLPPDAPLEPQSEIAAILVLSPRLVRRTARQRVTYAEIGAAGDGSRVIVRDGLDVDVERIAVPTGLAAISVLAQEPG